MSDRASLVLGYVLAGGASSRFGTDKALVELRGKSMLARTAEVVSSVCSDAAVVAPEDKAPAAKLITVPDRWPGQGPLGGILTALLDGQAKTSHDSWCLIVSCDMPFLTPEWLRFLIARALQSGAEVAIPRSVHGWEPLCACWRVSALETIVPVFEAGTRKITEALNALHVEVLDEKEWKRFDSDGRLFWNMNTQADYDEVRRVLQAENM